MPKGHYALRMPASMLEALKGIAEEQGTSVNQLINVAIAEKVAILDLGRHQRLRQKAVGSASKALARLREKPATTPRKGDELPLTRTNAAIETD